MSRRSLGTATLAVALLSSGFLPLLGTANADACATWTDAKDDATTHKQGNENLRDPNMDIVAASFTTVGGKIVGTIKVQDLVEQGYTDVGDQYLLTLKAAGTIVKIVAERDELGVVAKATNIAGSTTGAATVDFDYVDNTVAITVSQAELDKAAGKATAGVVATDLFASTATHAHNAATVSPYDDTLLVAGLTYTIGAECTPALPSELPMPDTGCKDIGDDAKDGTPTITTGAAASDDPDLDITSVAFNSTADTYYAYIKVTKLAAKPATFEGHRFEVTFKSGTKTYTFSHGNVNVGKSASAGQTRGQTGSTPTTDSKLKVRGRYDFTNNTVIIMVDRAALDTVHGSALADGTVVTDVAAKTFVVVATQSYLADTAQQATAADRTYTFGTNKCFPPPPGVLTNVGKVTAQFTDAAAVAAKLTNAAGVALADKPVTFTIGSKSVTVPTDAEGIASTALNPGLVAGNAYTLVTTFAGDSSASEVSISTPFSVTAEKTKMALTVARSGTKRTVTAKLLDDDGKAVAGQVVTWYVNGKRVSAPKTNSSGVVTLSAVATQTVKAVFTGVTGKYIGITTQIKV